MCLRAAIRSPLRSKRAITSPVRPRAKASGLTRINVLSIGLLSLGYSAAGGLEGRAAGDSTVAPGSALRAEAERAPLVGAGAAPFEPAPFVPPDAALGPAADRRVRRGRASCGAWPTSASQYGQIFQRGSSGLPHTVHGSLSRRRQLGQRRNDFSTSNPQYWQCWCSRLDRRAWAAAISSSRSRTSSRYSGGRTIRYTIVPMKGNSDAAVAHATSIGSAIRRWASLQVQ